MKFMWRGILLAISLVTLHIGSSSSVAGTPYKSTTVDHGGRITGRVRLAGTPPSNVPLGCSKDTKVCGASKRSPRLQIGKENGVCSALVMLEGIVAGKPFPVTTTPLITQKNCEYVPHLLVVPSGSPVEILNADPILHNVHAYQGDPGTASVFNIAQPIRGHRTTVKADQLAAAGVYRLTCDAGHPWMSAYIFVAENPYYAVTDKDGGFALDNVPPGTYRIRLWHEGVRTSGQGKPGAPPSSYVYEAPYEEGKEVTVAAGGSASVDFEIALR